MKAQLGTGEMRVRMSAEREREVQLRTLSRALRDVHRSLMETARDRYEFVRGHVRGRGELFDLLLHGDDFAWLGALTGLIVEIDELAARDPAPTPAETEEVGTLVRALISSSDDPDAFGSCYVALLASEPRVVMSHIDLRHALGRLPEPEQASGRAERT